MPARKPRKPLYSNWKADLRRRGIKTKPLFTKKYKSRPSLRQSHNIRNPSRYTRRSESREVLTHGEAPYRLGYEIRWDPHANWGMGGHVEKEYRIPTGPRPITGSTFVRGRVVRVTKSKRRSGKGKRGEGAVKGSAAAKRSIARAAAKVGGMRGGRVGKAKKKLKKK